MSISSRVTYVGFALAACVGVWGCEHAQVAGDSGANQVSVKPTRIKYALQHFDEIPECGVVEWTLKGYCNGVDVDQATGTAYGVRDVKIYPRDDRWELLVTRVSPYPHSRKDIKITGEWDWPMYIRLARLSGSEEPDFVMHKGWGETITAYNNEGEKLWVRNTETLDEVIVAPSTDTAHPQRDNVYFSAFDSNGRSFVSLDHEGNVRWSSTEIGWKFQFTPSFDIIYDYRGELKRVNRDGVLQGTFPCERYTRMVCGNVGEESLIPVVVESEGRLKEFAGTRLSDNKQIWNTKLRGVPDFYNSDGGVAAPDSSWIAYGLRDGTILVLDSQTGEIIARHTAGYEVHYAWIRGVNGENPKLVTGASSGMSIVRFDIPERKGQTKE